MSDAVSLVTPATGNPAGDDADWLTDFTRGEMRAQRRDQLIIWLERLGMAGILLGIWQVLQSLRVVSAATFSDPAAVVKYFFGTLLTQPGFWPAVRLTFEEMIFGLVLGVVAGTVVGIVVGLLPRVASASEPVVLGLNAVPKVALAPLAVVWLGLGIESKILIAALGVFFAIFFNVVGGVADLDRLLIQNVRMLGLSRRQELTTVTLPAISVWVVAALKVSISLALVGAIVGEYVGANAGIGYEIYTAINTVQVTRMVALLAVVAIMGGIAYAVVAVFERWILRWQ